MGEALRATHYHSLPPGQNTFGLRQGQETREFDGLLGQVTAAEKWLSFCGRPSHRQPTLDGTPSNTEPGSRSPVRLRVSYRTPRGLLSEFTRSVGAGSVTLDSKKQVPVGTRFLFEMCAAGMKEPVEVLGEVCSVRAAPAGGYELEIRYQRGADRHGLESALDLILQAHRYEKSRGYPRIPLKLEASEERPGSPAYLVRDLSLGGVGVAVEWAPLPGYVKVDAPFLLEVSLSIGELLLHGEVVWVFTPPPAQSELLSPCFGVKFGKLRRDTEKRLEQILALDGLPPPPWRARVSFGMEAVSRMP